MKTTDALIGEYVMQRARAAWSTSTQRSEYSRLSAVAEVLDGDPDRLWDTLKARGTAPYSRLTTWTRVVGFWQWALDRGYRKGPNRYRVFKEENAKAFRNTYQVRTPDLSFEEARERILGLEDGWQRAKALQLLEGGLRWTESFKVEAGSTVGKGDAKRRVFVEEVPGGNPREAYRRFLTALRKQVGLKPHDLRKLCATRLGREGLQEQDLCKVMGWKSFLTAKSYLQPMKDEELAQKFRAIQGVKDDSKESVS